MATSRTMAPVLAILYLWCGITFLPASAASFDAFLQCLSPTIPGDLVHQQSSTTFQSVLQSSVQNPRFLTGTTVRPLCIITASGVPHVQAAVRCGRANGVRLRVRSGGHDFEGLSYRSVQPEPFAVLDLARLRGVRVRAGEDSAWVDAGATLGEVYHAVGTANPGFLFPGGVCPTVGVSGFIGGGGIGLMMRKHGVGGDNVVDAKIVTADGDVLDRAAMGEDLFWAIRGGRAESFGVVVAWRLKLSTAPPTVTVVSVNRTVEQGAADLLAKWEASILGPASFVPDLAIRVVLQGRSANFQTLFLGRCSDLLDTMSVVLPELGTTAADCNEMTWLRAMAFIYFGGAGGAPVEALLDRTNGLSTYYKTKSDYVRRAVGRDGWASLFEQWLSRNGHGGIMTVEPHGAAVGGGVNDTASSPYAHRRGVLFNIQYGAMWWGEANGTASSAAVRWLYGLYEFLGQFASSNPREAYPNYRNLDIGRNVVGRDGLTAYSSGRVWGERYFMGNFRRLATVKGKVDPSDYFRNEQSIPPLLSQS